MNRPINFSQAPSPLSSARVLARDRAPSCALHVTAVSIFDTTMLADAAETCVVLCCPYVRCCLHPPCTRPPRTLLAAARLIGIARFAQLGLVVHANVCARLGALQWTFMQQAAMEVALIILPMAVSLLGGWYAACAIGVGLLGVFFLASGSAVPATAANVHRQCEDGGGGMLHPLTLFRALMMAQTAFCILAVDFRVLPRRFAKSPHWGTSVMDIGIASAAFSRSFVQRSRPRQPGAHAGLQRTALRHAPLFCLGLARTAFILLSGYHQTLDEYGAHCNAFLVLGIAGIVVDRLASTRASMAAAAGIGLLSVHQAAMAAGLASWVETAERQTLLSSNKEAVVCAIGLVGIECVGNAVGGSCRSQHVSLLRVDRETPSPLSPRRTRRSGRRLWLLRCSHPPRRAGCAIWRLASGPARSWSWCSACACLRAIGARRHRCPSSAP
jgi:hypothetical protein